jgi:hypothetical protein
MTAKLRSADMLIQPKEPQLLYLLGGSMREVEIHED